jgi:hypothetical protein
MKPTTSQISLTVVFWTNICPAAGGVAHEQNPDYRSWPIDQPINSGWVKIPSKNRSLDAAFLEGVKPRPV